LLREADRWRSAEFTDARVICAINELEGREPGEQLVLDPFLSGWFHRTAFKHLRLYQDRAAIVDILGAIDMVNNNQ